VLVPVKDGGHARPTHAHAAAHTVMVPVEREVSVRHGGEAQGWMPRQVICTADRLIRLLRMYVARRVRGERSRGDSCLGVERAEHDSMHSKRHY
jgi:hypothetical protein